MGTRAYTEGSENQALRDTCRGKAPGPPAAEPHLPREGHRQEAPTLRIMWAAACQPRVPMCLLKEMLRWVADS